MVTKSMVCRRRGLPFPWIEIQRQIIPCIQRVTTVASIGSGGCLEQAVQTRLGRAKSELGEIK
jgi:hypothetical protein